MTVDLYYRLNQLCINLPRLHDRQEDIPELAQVIFREMQQKFGKKTFLLPDVCLKRFAELPWPGNIREMQNLLGRLALLCDSKDDVLRFVDKIIAEEERYGYVVDSHARESGVQAAAAPPPSAFSGLPTLREAEKEVIRQALEACGNNISSAARVLGISRTTLYRKMSDLHLDGKR